MFLWLKAMNSRFMSSQLEADVHYCVPSAAALMAFLFEYPFGLWKRLHRAHMPCPPAHTLSFHKDVSYDQNKISPR